MRFPTCSLLLLLTFAFFGCKSSEYVPRQDGAGGALPGVDETEVGPVTSVACEINADCNDGAFCNGVETCVAGFCHLGIAPKCDDGIDCTEDRCSHATNSCLFVPPDKDGDGHADASCLGPSGESLGDDCDDDDPRRFPGNIEVCTEFDPRHDEDCNPTTFGHLDKDEDGVVSNICCNESDDGDVCGEDCDDESFRVFPEHPEICDGIDNDCDGRVDVDTKEVLWYPDADGDNYGDIGSEGVLDCSPVEGHALRPTDCNDGTASVHAAALEVCDGVDNDCDGDIDEGGVCACAPEGNARACACSDKTTGVQSCVGGLWGTCDCSECVTGTSDCLADLLPRTCVAKRWVFESACTGIRPLCDAGECLCLDGTDNCQEIADVVGPTIVAAMPQSSARRVPLDAALTIVFSENIATLSATTTAVTLHDGFNNPVPGAIAVGGSMLSFTPSAPLAPGMDYEWQIQPTITDLAGNEMNFGTMVSFSTVATVVSTSIEDPPTLIYNEANLAVSPNGSAMILARRTEQVGDNFVEAGVAQLDFNGSDWVDVGIAWTQTDPRTLAIDDQGWAVATRKASGTVYRYDLQGAGWSSGVILSSDDSVGVAPVVASNGAGNALTAVRVEGELTAGIRSPAGSYSAASTVALNDMPYRVGDVSEAGHGLLAYGQGDELHVWRSTVMPLSTWIKAAPVGDGTAPVTDAAALVLEDGTGTVAWVQYLANTNTGISRDQLQLQDVDEDGLWQGSPEYVGGAWKSYSETLPQLGSDAHGNTHLVYVRDHKLAHVVRRPAGGAWGPDAQLSVDNTWSLTGLRLAVAANGEAVAIWLGANDLWGARYAPDEGWALPERLENTDHTIFSAQLGIDSEGNAHVIYRADKWYALVY